jgi:serine/threonine protein kinase
MTLSSSRPENRQEINAAPSFAGKYRLLRLLDRSCPGGLYLVEMVVGGVGQPLALRLLPRKVGRDPVLRDRLLSGIRLSRRAVHPSIAQIRDVGEDAAGHLFFTTDHFPGMTLDSLIRREGRLPPERAVHLALRLLEVLREAHAAGVVHGSLDTSGILVRYEEDRPEISIRDLGLAAALPIRAACRLFPGSTSCLSPERLLDEGLSFSSDTYGVGAVLYECLTGLKPYRGITPAEVLGEQKRRPVTPPGQVFPPLTSFPCLEETLLRSLERNPERRYPTAKSFSEDLRTALRPPGRGLQGGSAPRHPSPSIPPEGISRIRLCRIRNHGRAIRDRRDGKAIFASAFFVLMAAIGALFWFCGDPKKSESLSPSPLPPLLQGVHQAASDVLPRSSGITFWKKGWSEMKNLGKPLDALVSFKKAWEIDRGVGKVPEDEMLLAIVEASGAVGDQEPWSRKLDMEAQELLAREPLDARTVVPLLRLLVQRFDPRRPAWPDRAKTRALFMEANAHNIPGIEASWWEYQEREKKWKASWGNRFPGE